MEHLFIVHYPESPVCVPDKGKITIGRADNNTIVIPELRVSRLHAHIEWREFLRKYVLVDLGSSNGSFLNNVKVTSLHETPLNDRDKIRIASSVLTLRFANDISVINNEFIQLRQRIHCQVTEIIDMKDLKKMSSHAAEGTAAISGDLRHLCPIELFQLLETGCKTGLLNMTTALGQGNFHVLKGKIVTARLKNLQGEQAVFETLKCSSGPFEFLPLPNIAAHHQITCSTTALLMEGCKLLDEALAVS
jgi:pSer/pThr/pTyr-binding forkhead associated (FHA) protein